MKSFFIFMLITIGISIISFDFYENSYFSSKTIVLNFLSINFIIYIILKISKFKKYFCVSSIDIVLSFLFIFIFINSFSRDNFMLSLRFYDLISLTIFYIFLRLFLIKNKYIIYSILGIVTSLFINTLYGFGQFFNISESLNSNFSITGSFFNPAPFAGLITIGSIFNLFIILHKGYISKQISNLKYSNSIYYINIIILSLNIILLVLLESRASWISLLGGGLFLLFMKVRYKFSSYIFNLVYILAGACITILCGSLSYFLRQDSVNGRIFIWKISHYIIKDNPIIGTGLDTFKVNYMPYQAYYFSLNNDTQKKLLSDNIVYAFNDFIQIFVEQGILGLFLFLIIFFLIIKKISNSITILGCSIIISLSIFSCFSYSLQILPLKILIIFGISICSIYDNKVIKISCTYIFLKFIPITLFSTLCIFQIKSQYYLHMGYSNWKKAMNYYSETNFKKSIIYFEKAYPYLKTNGEFLMQYGKTLNLNNKFIQSNNILHLSQLFLNNTIIQTTLGDNYKELHKYDEAEQHYKFASYMTPNRLYPHYLLVKMYQEKGDIKKAKRHAEILVKTPIKVPSTIALQIKEEMKDFIDKNHNIK